MIGTFSTKFAATARRAGLAAVLGVAAATVVGFAGAAHASPSPFVPNADHELGMYGNPAAAARYWVKQHEGDCGLTAIADVVGQITGHQPTEQEIIAQAKKTTRPGLNGPIYPTGSRGGMEGGTDRGGMPVLLAHYGIRSSAEKEISTSELERALGRGDKVIALLNAETIWNDPPGRGQRTDEDHAVVVTGIDTKAGVVHLNDSGIDTGKDEQVSIATFEQAWATSTKDRKPGSGDVFQVPASEFRL